MKASKYIFTFILLILVVNVNAQNVKGIVLLADEPIKGAVISENNTELAKTNTNGEFEINESVSKVIVTYKNLEKAYTFESLGLSTVVLVPAEKQFLKMMEKNPSIDKCSIFIENYPQSESLQKVVMQKEELTFIAAYEKAVTTYDVTELDVYLATYPEGTYSAKATQTMEVISWQHARLQDTPQSYNEFLAKYPESKAAKEAVARIEKNEEVE